MARQRITLNWQRKTPLPQAEGTTVNTDNPAANHTWPKETPQWEGRQFKPGRASNCRGPCKAMGLSSGRWKGNLVAKCALAFGVLLETWPAHRTSAWNELIYCNAIGVKGFSKSGERQLV